VSDADVATLKAAYQAFNDRDAGRLAEFFDPEAMWLPAMDVWAAGTVYRGRAGIASVIEDVERDWDVFVAEPQEFREVGDLLLVTGRVRARTKGGEREIDRETAWIWEMRDGLALRLQTYADPRRAEESLGVQG
jgi:ketosteroid isomerase-like protein